MYRTSSLLLICFTIVLLTGCGNPQQELWQKYDIHLMELNASSEHPAYARYAAKHCLSTLNKIKEENPNAIKPNKPNEGDNVDSLIKTMEGIIDAQERHKPPIENDI